MLHVALLKNLQIGYEDSWFQKIWKKTETVAVLNHSVKKRDALDLNQKNICLSGRRDHAFIWQNWLSDDGFGVKWFQYFFAEFR